MSKKRELKGPESKPQAEPSSTASLGGAKPQVFVSHDSRDADIAEAFANLLTDASGGILKSFRSSDRKGTAGIEFGEEWYKAIMERLDTATNVVALLTQTSIDRPWILYETGVASGKLGTTVFGLAIGIPLEQASTGPFYRFQNCADDEDSLTKLVLQLIRRNPEAAPREEAVRRQVQAFRQGLGVLIEHRAKSRATSPAHVDESAVAKLFEEVKVMFRDLPDQVEGKLHRASTPPGFRRMRAVHPGMLEDLLFNPALRGSFDAPLGWLLFISMLRDELPWLYELGMEFYRALRSRQRNQVAEASQNLRKAVDLFAHGPWREMYRGSERDKGFFLTRHLPEMLDHFLSEMAGELARILRPPRRRGAAPDSK